MLWMREQEYHRDRLQAENRHAPVGKSQNSQLICMPLTDEKK